MSCFAGTSDDNDSADADKNDTDTNENTDGATSHDNVTSCSPRDTVVAETDQPDIDSRQRVTTSTVATAASRLPDRQLVCCPTVLQ